MWALITEIPLATAWPKINRAHKRKMPKRNFVLEMVYAAWARARRNPYIENPSICSILRNYSCEASANVQWEQRAFQVRVAVAMREDSSVHNGWQATSQTELVTAAYPALFSALNCHCRKLHKPGTACYSTHRMPASSLGLPPREQLITVTAY